MVPRKAVNDAWSDPSARFDGRADDYDRYRPGYPGEVANLLVEELGVAKGRTVCELGSGTGIFARFCLERGWPVVGVEPNAEMRAIAESRLAAHAGFRSVAGTAEDTGLPPESVDLVVAAQAFHWFDARRTAREARRIGGADAKGVVVWNERRVAGTPFLVAYEALLRRWGTDYQRVAELYDHADGLLQFFGGPHGRRTFPHAQRLDLSGLRGRLRSASYVPSPGHRDHDETMSAVDELFVAHAEEGHVTIEYDTVVCFGPLATQP